MRLDVIPMKSSLLPPGCPNCQQLMSFKAVERRSLLRGNQLNNYTFECINCGYSSAHLVEEHL